MEIKEKDELLVLYIDEDNNYHQILLNSLELKMIGSEIAQIFAAKKMDVLVSDKKLRLIEEDETNDKKDSGEVQ